MSTATASSSTAPFDQGLNALKLVMAEATLPPVYDVATWLDRVYPPPCQLLVGAVDKGTKLAIIGAAKNRKTWFALHMGAALASGTPFMQWPTTPCRVLFVNLEIPEAHMQQRVAKVLTGMNAKKLPGALHIMNARGRARDVLVMEQVGRAITAEWSPAFMQKVKDSKYDLVIFGPLYKLQSIGDENRTEDLKPVLHAFDTLAEDTRVAIAYVHHMAKGYGGERQTIDRAAGSGAIARDYDTCITLTPHAADDLIVMETSTRNYKAPEDTSIRWNIDTGRFELDNTPPQVRTAKTVAAASGMSEGDMRAVALNLVQGSAIPNAEWEHGMRTAGVPRHAMLQIGRAHV